MVRWGWMSKNPADYRGTAQKGQKAGWYAIPCNWFAALGDFPARGTNVKMKDLFLRDDTGALLPAIDGSQPLDVTHPEWEKWPGQPSGI